MTPTLIRSPIPRALAAAVVLSAAALLCGCSSTPPQPEPQAGGAPPPTAPTAASTAASVETPRPSYRGPWEDPSSPLYHRTIYFDYDSAEIKPQYLEVIRTHSAYLGKTTAQRVTLEGNTDERGTREYNLALGDRRAESVRQLMLAEGVTPAQMATLSYGEERPADPGHTENAWRLNRRVIIQY
jgi:peptidoglycan-associated lipoprotein